MTLKVKTLSLADKPNTIHAVTKTLIKLKKSSACRINPQRKIMKEKETIFFKNEDMSIASYRHKCMKKCRRNVDPCPADSDGRECGKRRRKIQSARLKSNQAYTAGAQRTEQASFTDCNGRFATSVWVNGLEARS